MQNSPEYTYMLLSIGIKMSKHIEEMNSHLIKSKFCWVIFKTIVVETNSLLSLDM